MAQRDFPILEELAIAGATDYFAELVPVGMVTEAFPDSGIGFSFATDHPEGFGNDDLRLIEAVLPAVSLAIVSDAEHTIAAGLLAAYLGCDAGRRVHAGVVERGSVESIQAIMRPPPWSNRLSYLEALEFGMLQIEWPGHFVAGARVRSAELLRFGPCLEGGFALPHCMGGIERMVFGLGSL